MEMLKQALLAILTADHPQTVRQVFYQMVSRGFVDKTEQEYDGTVCRLLGEMREDGRVPWDWVIDNTRWVRRPVTYDELSHAIYSLARGYRRDLWKNADHYVEIWVEKDALAGVLEAETEPLDVPLLAAKGYSSLSFLHAAALNIADLDKPAYIYHLGDSDPSGENAALVIERDLRKYAPSAEFTSSASRCWTSKSSAGTCRCATTSPAILALRSFTGRDRSSWTRYPRASFASSFATPSCCTSTRRSTPR